jgi:hypothetical protein
MVQHNPGKSCLSGYTWSVFPTSKHFTLSPKGTKKTNNETDSPPLRPLGPPRLHPLPLQTHPPNPLPLQPMARVQQPRSTPIRPSKPPPNSRTNPRRTLNPLIRRVQRRDPLRGHHAGTLCQ